MKILLRKQCIGTLILLTVISACSFNKTGSVPRQKIELPNGYNYGGAIWLPDGRLLFFFRDQNDPRSVVKYFDLGDGEVHRLPLGDDPQCTRYTEYGGPIVLPDGRLGLIKRCAGLDPTRPGLSGDEAYLMTYDWNTGALEQIVQGALPRSGLSGEFTWDPDMTRGVQALTGLIGTIYWISPSGWEPMTVTVSHGQRSWSLDENFAALQDPNKVSSVGIALAPAWSSDGNVIAFLATLDAIGVRGPARGDGEYNLFLMDPDGLSPKSALDQIYDPTLLIWSPDSQWLAFNGYAGNERRDGLWLFSPAQGSLKLIAEGNVADAVWSADGKEIVAMLCLDIPCLSTEIWKYDVSQIVG